MSSRTNYIFGIITIGAIIGVTVYAIKKSRDVKEQEEQAISVEEALEMTADRREGLKVVNEEEHVIFEQPIVKPIISDEIELDEGMEDFDFDEDDIDENTEGPLLTVEPLVDFTYIDDDDSINPKEDTTLRHEPDSNEARHQYIRMELADWRPDHPIYRILIQMFEIPFIPTNDGDEILRTQIIDHKVKFFGWASRWNKEVSYADVLFHYARAAEFNCDESVQYWIEYFLDFNEFDWDMPTHEFDTLILRLNSHSYFNEETETFGLFGLTRESMNQAIRIANRNIDRSVTYEIEFNEFLKSSL